MMGRGAEGGCGTEEKPCPVSRSSPPACSPVPASVTSPEKLGAVNLGVDFYSQALKALSERSPFDSDEVLAKTVATLPSGLAGLLSKQSDSKKKHKRPHSETKSSRKGSTEKSKNSALWTELEDYFRELTLQDIERLHRFSTSFDSLLDSSNSLLKIPALKNGFRSSSNDDNINKVEDGHSDNPVAATIKEEEEEVVLDADVPMPDAGGLQDKEDDDKDTDKLPDVKIENGSSDSLNVVEKGPSPEYTLPSCSSIEWVLGSRNRVLLTTTRPTKKRKLLGANAGLERLIVAQPCEGSSSLCHVCSMGDSGDQLNQLVACKSCKVVVHQKCYGVQGEIDGSWLCSWCKNIVDAQAGPAPGSDRPCVFFMWMPEVYIDDTRLMEPVLCQGMKDVRGKLVCNLCKLKLGSCVRCSDGSCRTAFHPLCAREAKHKLEVWGRFGCDDIELRAFCSKHSGNFNPEDSVALESHEQNHAVGSDLLGSSIEPASLPENKIKKLKIGCKNGDKVTLQIGVADADSNNLGEREWQDQGQDANSNTKLELGSGDGEKLSDMGLGGACEDVKISRLLDLGLVLKKLINRGKVSLEHIASQIGISEDSLAARLTDNQLSPELYFKLFKWLKGRSYLDTAAKDWREKLRCLMPSEAELNTDDRTDAVTLRHFDISDDVPVKSVPPRRRTVGNIRILNEDKDVSLCNDKRLVNGASTKEAAEHEDMNDDNEKPSKDSISDSIEEIMVDTNGVERPTADASPTSDSTILKPNSHCDIDYNGAEEGTSSGKSSLLDLDQDTPSCSSVYTVGYCDGNSESGINSSVHPYIQKKLDEVQSWLSRRTPDIDGCVELESLAMEQTVNAEKKVSVCNDEGGEREVKADEMGVSDLSPENELEGEIIFFQQQLLCNTVALKRKSDQLVCKIVKSLPNEMDSVRKRRWDSVHVNQYIYELKEARKQVSSLRKDMVDESSPQENLLKVESGRVRGSLSSLSAPRTKVSNPTLDAPKAKSDGYSDVFQFSSGTPKEHPKSCDICRRSESLLNPILVCSSCKVAVHLNCYRSVKESTGPWYCELCDDSSSSKVSRATVISWENSNPIEECGLCGASNGAFRKSSNGQWVHAYCAEWVFDSTFKRGQVSPVIGMETLPKGNDMCCVCHKKFGVCIKCNYGNCQSTFHPSCARSADYYMYTKYIGGGKMQHKAYCSKHSLEQRTKAETQKHGVEDLKIVKQHRVELEKLRLLCERIVKREKLKRELVICNHDVFASKRDSLVFSMLVHRPFSSHESSDSATTSLKGHVDGSRSCSDAMQRSDDITVDSALSTKRRIRLPLSIDNDKKTEVSSTSRHHVPKPPDRGSFAGKQIPVRAALASRDFSQSMDNSLNSRKHLETFEKELVMTSDQASLKNRRLPKGYIYVPIDYLSNGKPVRHNSVEREEVDD
uniref:PHD finger family protein n=1 Tax=Chenopodium quinoa TaxID=63459 RepID=A0A803M586_CHEQI